jgi:hypothetical protein
MFLCLVMFYSSARIFHYNSIITLTLVVNSFQVVYIVCPVSDPAGILQTMVDACSSLGSAISNADSQRHGAASTPGEDGLPSNILGFSTPRFALQLITAETVFKSSGPQASSVDVLKEVALGVYNKVRRIPKKAQSTECAQSGGASVPRGQAGNAGPSQVQTNASMPGLWKDCSGQRSSGNATMSAMNSGNNHNMWEGGWKPSMQTDLGTCSLNLDLLLGNCLPKFENWFGFPKTILY